MKIIQVTNDSRSNENFETILFDSAESDKSNASDALRVVEEVIFAIREADYRKNSSRFGRFQTVSLTLRFED